MSVTTPSSLLMLMLLTVLRSEESALKAERIWLFSFRSASVVAWSFAIAPGIPEVLDDEVEPLIPGVVEPPRLLPLSDMEPVVPGVVGVPVVPGFDIVSLERELIPLEEEVPLPGEEDGLPIVELELSLERVPIAPEEEVPLPGEEDGLPIVKLEPPGVGVEVLPVEPADEPPPAV